MSDTRHDPQRRTHTPSMADEFMEFDPSADNHRLRAEVTWNTGQTARTLVKYDDLRIVLTALQPSQRMPEHKTEGRIALHVLAGPT